MAYNPLQGRLVQTDDTLVKIGELFQSRGESFEDEDAERLMTDPPKLPQFPIVMVLLAGFKDLLDIPLDLSLVLAIFVFFTSLLISGIIAIWCFGKISGGWWKKSLIRWLWLRFFIMLGVELIPFVQMVPANTIFILMAHYKETKIVKLFDEALGILHSGGAGKAGTTVAQAFRAGLRKREEEDGGGEGTISRTARGVSQLSRTPVGKGALAAAQATPVGRVAGTGARVASMAAVRNRQIERGGQTPPQQGNPPNAG